MTEHEIDSQMDHKCKTRSSILVGYGRLRSQNGQGAVLWIKSVGNSSPYSRKYGHVFFAPEPGSPEVLTENGSVESTCDFGVSQYASDGRPGSTRSSQHP